jgi:transforming growth factor-beta-induced protein
VVPAVAALGTQTSRQLQTTVVDLAVATGSLSTLVTAVTTAQLATALNDPDATLTVFAPDNDAFAALSTGLLDALLTPGFKMHLTEILSYHVFADGAVLSAALAATQTFEMLNNEFLTVTKTGFGVAVTTSSGRTTTVTTADVEGSNGVVHIIDGVLVPSSIGTTVIDLGLTYSTLLSLISIAGLGGTLAEGPWTLFAPTNTAFAELSSDTLDYLVSDAGAADLAGILTYHVISESVTSDMVVDGATVVTVQGRKVTFSVGDTVMVNDATVVDPDILAFNGVTHGIDKVLMPPGTVVDLVKGTGALSTLEAAVIKAKLVDALSDPEASLTVFAPDNDAFGALPTGVLARLLTPEFNMHLTEILLYHALDGAILSSVLAGTQEIEMSNFEMLTVTKTEFGVLLTTTKGQTVTVTTADVEGSNGVVHIIDGVLLPSSIGDTILDLGANYSTLLSLITTAGLEGNLSVGRWTLFAPTNTAFEVLDTETVNFLTSDDGAMELKSILTYHVVGQSLTSDLVTDGAAVANAQGKMLTFSVDGDTVMVNDATIVEMDMLAYTGVTHGINKIVMASSASVGVTMAPTMAPTTTMSGGLALSASFSALFAAVLAVAL